MSSSSPSSSLSSPKLAKIVIVDYNDLLVGATSSTTNSTTGNNNDEIIMNSLEEAFGCNGSGIICIKNIPGFVELKNKVLPIKITKVKSI